MRTLRFNILGLLVLFSLLFVIAGVTTSKAKAAEQYRLVSATQVAAALDQAKGQRTVFFLYTSWCPYCRKSLPEISEIAKDYPGRVIAVSLDKDPETLWRYLQKQYADVPFTPYVWNRRDIFAKPLERFGIQPGNGIPFTALVDAHGYVHKQGVLSPSVARAYIEGGALK